VDFVAIVLGIALFVVMLALIDGIDRV